MKIRQGIRLGIAVAGAVAASAGAPALAGDRYASKVTLASSFPAFHGKVKSKAGDACIEDRRVRLYSELAGGDDLLGKTRTSAKGRWKIVMEPSSGVYYAKVKSGGSGGVKCKGDRSKPVVID